MQLMVFFVVTNLVAGVLASPVPRCEEPDDVNQLQRKLNEISDTAGIEKIDIPSSYNATRKYLVYGSPTCPSWDMSVTYREDCPVYFTLNVDPNRKPYSIIERQCACSHPPTSDGTSLADCVPLVQDLLVYRRTDCIDGIYKYNITLETVQMGCTSNLNVRGAQPETPKSPL